VSTTYYCWTCGAEADHSVPPALHYEHRLRLVRFCSAACRAGYQWLAAL
jgi:hypothetical protein